MWLFKLSSQYHTVMVYGPSVSLVLLCMPDRTRTDLGCIETLLAQEAYPSDHSFAHQVVNTKRQVFSSMYFCACSCNR